MCSCMWDTFITGDTNRATEKRTEMIAILRQPRVLVFDVVVGTWGRFSADADGDAVLGVVAAQWTPKTRETQLVGGIAVFQLDSKLVILWRKLGSAWTQTREYLEARTPWSHLRIHHPPARSFSPEKRRVIPLDEKTVSCHTIHVWLTRLRCCSEDRDYAKVLTNVSICRFEHAYPRDDINSNQRSMHSSDRSKRYRCIQHNSNAAVMSSTVTGAVDEPVPPSSVSRPFARSFITLAVCIVGRAVLCVLVGWKSMSCCVKHRWIFGHCSVLSIKRPHSSTVVHHCWYYYYYYYYYYCCCVLHLKSRTQQLALTAILSLKRFLQWSISAYISAVHPNYFHQLSWTPT